MQRGNPKLIARQDADGYVRGLRLYTLLSFHWMWAQCYVSNT